MMRFLRLARLAKVARIRKLKHPDEGDYAEVSKLNVRIYFAALLSSVLILGSLIYVIESTNQNFPNMLYRHTMGGRDNCRHIPRRRTIARRTGSSIVWKIFGTHIIWSPY